MGDRCYMQVTCRPADLEAALPDWRKKLGFDMEDEVPDHPEQILLSFDEVNYANIRDYGDFPDKVPFIATNTPGCDYPEGETVFDGENESFVACIDGCYLFEVNAKGSPIPSEGIREHVLMKARVKRYLKSGNREHLKDES